MDKTFEWIIRNRKFAALVLAFVGVMWFLNRLLLSDDFVGTVTFVTLLLAKYALSAIMLLPSGFTQLLLGAGPFVVTPGNVGILVLLYSLANVAVFASVGYFAYQFLTFRWKYGKTLGKTLMEFLQSHASLSDLFSRTADFAANNKFYAVTVFVFLAVLLIGGFLPKSQYFVFVDSDTETVKYGKITKDSYDKWLKDPVKNTRLFVTVEDSTDPSVQSVSFPVGKANFSTVWGMLEFVIPRAISKVFPPDGVALAKSRSETLAAMKAEPYAPGFSGRLEPLVDAEFATVFSGSGEFVTSWASDPTIEKAYGKFLTTYPFYPDYVADRTHFEAIASIPNASLRGMAYLLSIYSKQKYLTLGGEMKDVIYKKVGDGTPEQLASVTLIDSGMASTFNQLLAVALLLLFGMFNRVLVVGLTLKRIFTGKDTVFSDGTKVTFGDAALRSVDADTMEFDETAEEAKARMAGIAAEKNSVWTLDETAGIAAEVEKLGLAAVLGNIEAGKYADAEFDPKEYAKGIIAAETEEQIRSKAEEMAREEQRIRDEETGKVYRSEMADFLVYSDSDSDEERQIKEEYNAAREKLERGNAEKDSLEQLKGEFEGRLENERKREGVQKELAEIDSKQAALKRLISEEPDAEIRKRLEDSLEEGEKARAAKFEELAAITDYSSTLEEYKRDFAANLENNPDLLENARKIRENNEEGARIMEEHKKEPNAKKRRILEERMEELHGKDRILKNEGEQIRQVLEVKNLNDWKKNLESDYEKVKKRVELEKEERGYSKELEHMKELKREKKSKWEDTEWIDREIEKMQSKISNVGEKILNEMSSSSDGEKDTADRTDLNEARNNVKPFSVRAEYAKKLDDNKDGIRAKLRDLEWLEKWERATLSIKETDIEAAKKYIERKKTDALSEKNPKKKQVLNEERREKQEELKALESDRERIISGLESLRKQISGMREEEMSVFLKLKAVEDTMRKPKEEGGFWFGEESTWSAQESEWKKREKEIKETIRSKYVWDHAKMIRKNLEDTGKLISKAVMTDAIANQMRLTAESWDLEYRLHDAESALSDHEDAMYGIEKKVIGTLFEKDTSEKRSELEARISEKLRSQISKYDFSDAKKIITRDMWPEYFEKIRAKLVSSGFNWDKIEKEFPAVKTALKDCRVPDESYDFESFAAELKRNNFSEENVEAVAAEIFEKSKEAIREKALAAASIEDLKSNEKILSSRLKTESDEKIAKVLREQLAITKTRISERESDMESYSEDAKGAMTEEYAAVETLKKKIRAYGNGVNWREAANQLEVLKKRIVESDKALVAEYNAAKADYERLKKESESLPEGSEEKRSAEERRIRRYNEINEKGYPETHQANIRALELAKR